MGKQLLKKLTAVNIWEIIIDDELKWNLHIENIYKKLMKYTSIFYKLRDKLPDQMLREIYVTESAECRCSALFDLRHRRTGCNYTGCLSGHECILNSAHWRTPFTTKNLHCISQTLYRLLRLQLFAAVFDHLPQRTMSCRGGAAVLKVGGQFYERSSQKIFFDPPLFGQWGDKILLR